MALTQDNRYLKVYTPLGKDFVVLEDFTADESVSELFSYQLHLVHEEVETSQEQTVVDPQKILGQPVTTEVKTRDGRSRFFNGIVTNWRQGLRRIRFTHYHAQVAPKVWLLTQIRQSRIFQRLTVPEILKKVFEGYNVKYELEGNFHQRDYCVQYNETDFDFASRLMEEEGFYYFFKHAADDHTMIVANTPQSHIKVPGKSELPFTAKLPDAEFQESSVLGWDVDYRLQTGKVSLRDHNFELPQKKLQAEEPTRYAVAENGQLEIYAYPGGYAKRYTDIDKGGGQQNELKHVFDDKETQAELQMQAIDSTYELITGVSDAVGLTAGYKFTLFNHPVGANNGEYMIRKVIHEARQTPSLETGEEVADAYKNSFICLPLKQGGSPFRPSRKTPKPKIHGTQTAIVVGPPGEEIFTDKYGRIKVQFHWDREGQYQIDSSCWIRVAQPWAGNNWGTICIPRIGQEVVVEFLEGDPDRPLVTGAVYNPEQMPPYELPEAAHTMGFKSNTTKGGGGYNEMAIVDGKDGELIRIHAQKDMDTTVLNNDTQYVVVDRQIQVDGTHTETIKGDMSTTVTEGDQTNVVTAGDQTNLVEAGDQANKVVAGNQSNEVSSGNQSNVVKAGEMAHIAKGNLVVVSEDGIVHIEAGTQIELICGASSLAMDKSGNIQIKGTNVTVIGSTAVNLNP